MTLVHYTATVRADGLLELPSAARDLLLPGQEIEIDIMEASKQVDQPNESALETLRLLAEMKKDMPETDGSDTQRLLREARAGAMYGYTPNE